MEKENNLPKEELVDQRGFISKKLNNSLSPKAISEIREGTCNPIGAPQVTTDLSENIILTSLDDLHNWARLSLSLIHI